MSKRVLIVDDDPLLLQLLEGILRKDGYQVQRANDIQQALRAVQRTPPDAAIVDVELGQSESGLSLLGIWKTQFQFPVMVLSSRGQASDRVIGLELGAVDYLAKPFEPKELLLRLNIMLKRDFENSNSILNKSSWRIGNFEFDAQHRLLSTETKTISLSQFECELLVFLISKANRAVTREQILNAVQSREKNVNDRAVDVLVGRLRKKLTHSDVTIQSVRSIGYMVCGQITPH